MKSESLLIIEMENQQLSNKLSSANQIIFHMQKFVDIKNYECQLQNHYFIITIKCRYVYIEMHHLNDTTIINLKSVLHKLLEMCTLRFHIPLACV